jgi:hypothetical protein
MFSYRISTCGALCASGTQWSAFRCWHVVAPEPPCPSAPMCLGVTAATIFYRSLALKTERFIGQAREGLVLAVASVTAIMMTGYLLLLILY